MTKRKPKTKRARDWMAKAIKMRGDGFSITAIAEDVGKRYGTVRAATTGIHKPERAPARLRSYAAAPRAPRAIKTIIRREAVSPAIADFAAHKITIEELMERITA